MESSRKETEKKLAEANFETQQVCPAQRIVILSVSDVKKTWKWKNAFLNPDDSTLEPIETLRSENGDGRENVAEKVNSRSFNLHRDYSKSLTLSNVG